MPSNIVKSFAKKTGKSESEVEKLWDRAKKSAKDQGRKETDPKFYNLVTGILKKMLKINEGRKLLSFKRFMNEAKKYDSSDIQKAIHKAGYKAVATGASMTNQVFSGNKKVGSVSNSGVVRVKDSQIKAAIQAEIKKI
jgi:hypothetical protein